MTKVLSPARLVGPDLSIQIVLALAWRERRWLLVASALSAIVGIVVALSLQPEYASEAKVMPEMSNGAGDVVQRLASSVGFSGLDLSETEGVEAVRPDLYPNVLQSTPFLLELIGQPIKTPDEQLTTVGQLILPENTFVDSIKRFLGLKANKTVPPKTPQPNTPIQLTVRQKALLEAISERVSARFDTRSGVILISAKMPDANAAASVAQMAMNYLTRYVTNYRTEKARQDLHFYIQRLNEARQRYRTAQLRLFRHNDEHKSLILQTATMQRQQLSDELALAQSVYAELARQHEQARLKVQERTPVFKVLEPPTVPLERVSPKRTLLVLGFTIAGFLLGLVYRVVRKGQWLEQWWQLIQHGQ